MFGVVTVTALASMLLLVGPAGAAAAQDAAAASTDAPARSADEASAGAAAFERMKTLVGTWEAVIEKGKRATAQYELLSGGSVLVERYSDEGMPAGSEMLTMYHLDGEDLVLTHYCVAGNQPRMKAAPFDPVTGELRFEFAGATNLASAGAGHMHSAVFRLEEPNAFVTEWDYFEDGKRSFGEVLRFTRVNS